jgi:O-phospho-L-seryl-tRNASec:L-selenocysteinyl-tRNA synthase
MTTDIDGMARRITEVGSDRVVAILSTTSCFAPRQPDRIDEISRICKEHNIPHVVNNAYGLQCPVIAKMINKSSVVGRLDAGQQLRQSFQFIENNHIL